MEGLSPCTRHFTKKRKSFLVQIGVLANTRLESVLLMDKQKRMIERAYLEIIEKGKRK